MSFKADWIFRVLFILTTCKCTAYVLSYLLATTLKRHSKSAMSRSRKPETNEKRALPRFIAELSCYSFVIFCIKITSFSTTFYITFCITTEHLVMSLIALRFFAYQSLTLSCFGSTCCLHKKGRRPSTLITRKKEERNEQSLRPQDANTFRTIRTRADGRRVRTLPCFQIKQRN